MSDPLPSPWLPQFKVNLIYVWKAASVWVFSILGILAAIELAAPDLIGYPWDKIINVLLAALGPAAVAAPQSISPKETP